MYIPDCQINISGIIPTIATKDRITIFRLDYKERKEIDNQWRKEVFF